MKRLSLATLGVLVAAVALSGCGRKKAAKPAPRADGLVIEEVKEGTGPVATRGQTVSVHYTGHLTNGTKFDSSSTAASRSSSRWGPASSSRAGMPASTA